MSEDALNLAVFERAAELIRDKGFWDGTHDESKTWTSKRGYCIGLAILEQKGTSSADRDDAMDHLATQLGYTRSSFPDISSHGFVFQKNDEFRGRPEEGKAWALDVLDKLSRGESLV